MFYPGAWYVIYLAKYFIVDFIPTVHCVSVHLPEWHGEDINGYICEKVSARQIPNLETRKRYIYYWSYKAHSRVYPWSKNMATEEEKIKKSPQEVRTPRHLSCSMYFVEMNHGTRFSQGLFIFVYIIHVFI